MKDVTSPGHKVQVKHVSDTGPSDARRDHRDTSALPLGEGGSDHAAKQPRLVDKPLGLTTCVGLPTI